MHLEYFVVFLVLPVGAAKMVVLAQKYKLGKMNLRELEESLSVSDLSLGPAEELVGDVVLVTDVTALFLLVT